MASPAFSRSAMADGANAWPHRRDALLARFSSIDELKNAEVDELAQVPGMGRGAAEAVKEFFSGFANEQPAP